MANKILVTGSAGFIGFHLTKALLSSGYQVVGVDNINDYYDPQLKLNRLAFLNDFVDKNTLHLNYNFLKLDISESAALEQLFLAHDFDAGYTKNRWPL